MPLGHRVQQLHERGVVDGQVLLLELAAGGRVLEQFHHCWTSTCVNEAAEERGSGTSGIREPVVAGPAALGRQRHVGEGCGRRGAGLRLVDRPAEAAEGFGEQGESAHIGGVGGEEGAEADGQGADPRSARSASIPPYASREAIRAGPLKAA
jgi:hypothetical protein